MMDSINKRVVIGPSGVALVFLRAPQSGRVKKRLAMGLPPEVVLGLYRCFVEDIIDTVTKGAYPVQLYFTPQAAKSLMVNWLGSDFEYRSQQGQDLGRKMARAFDRAFRESYNRALLVGTDVPQISAKILKDAFNALDRYDGVIGPTVDGGYYLIGFRSETFRSEFFDNVAWGTDRVLSQTMALFLNSNLRIFTLPKLRDIDDMDDLRQFDFRNAPEAIRTIKFMKTYGLTRLIPNPISSTAQSGDGKSH
jgi:rSAM/selenodomain-associated transferase 1